MLVAGIAVDTARPFGFAEVPLEQDTERSAQPTKAPTALIRAAFLEIFEK